MKKGPQLTKKTKWHALEAEKILGDLDSDWKGLSSTEVEHRQNEYGLNSLPSRQVFS